MYIIYIVYAAPAQEKSQYHAELGQFQKYMCTYIYAIKSNCLRGASATEARDECEAGAK